MVLENDGISDVRFFLWPFTLGSCKKEQSVDILKAASLPVFSPPPEPVRAEPLRGLYLVQDSAATEGLQLLCSVRCSRGRSQARCALVQAHVFGVRS